MRALVGSGLTMRAACRVGPVHLRAFCSFSKLFSFNLWLFGVDLLPSKMNSVSIKISCHFFYKICGNIYFFVENLGSRAKVRASKNRKKRLSRPRTTGTFVSLGIEDPMVDFGGGGGTCAKTFEKHLFQQ